MLWYVARIKILKCWMEPVLKIFKRIIEVIEQEKYNIQFAFMGGKRKTDVIFIVRQLQEKYIAKKTVLWIAFVNLDKVLCEVVWWALRSRRSGVDRRDLRGLKPP